MRPRVLLSVGWLLVSALWADAASVIPLPAEQNSAIGAFTLGADSLVVAHPIARQEALHLVEQLAPATGFALGLRAARMTGAVRRAQGLCGRAEKPGCRSWIRFVRVRDRSLGDEGYRLEVAPGRVVIRARGAAGWFYGAQTLRQLLPPAILGSAVVTDTPWTAAATRIRDVPRFGYRGIMLDSARHFFPPATVRRLLEQMALHKLNHLHWHLSDDQGWRLEVRAFPNLTVAGAQRAETAVRPIATAGFLNFLLGGLGATWVPGFDGTPYAGHYSQAEIRALVAYAAALHITIVPELDMPGHIQAAIAAYPSLGSAPGPVPVKTSWGLPVAILNPSDETFAFISAVLDEVADLFPGPYLHMGGDEVDLTQWKTNPVAQARLTELGLPNETALKDWFVNRVMQMISDRERRPIGWSEVFHASLPEPGIVMVWLSPQLALTAARQGHDVIMAPLGSTYLDHANGLPLPAADQAALVAGAGANVAIAPLFVTDVAELYAFDPVLPGMTPREAAHVLGGQGQLWSEFIHDQTDIDRQAFPRLCALAEVLWSPAAARNLAGFQTRLQSHLVRLDALGVGYYRPSLP